MKIISPRRNFQRPRRRYLQIAIAEEASSPEFHQQPRPPAKKALLIGISYTSQAGHEDDTTVLRGPHRDVTEMKKLLVEIYDYHPDDVVVMMDSHHSRKGEVPTHPNILRQIQSLVRDAQPGDHLFFHYAGHVSQIENRNNSEEDGMDECLVPIDGPVIVDNELRTLLVDSLPIGCQLIAIFDSCHSASLLDLEHFRCNRVYVPWISKGKRRSDTIWNRNIRKHGIRIQSPRICHSRRTSKNNAHSRRTSKELGSPRSPLSPAHSNFRGSMTDTDISDLESRSPLVKVTSSAKRPKSFSNTSISKVNSPALSRTASPRRSRPLQKENSFWLRGLESGQSVRCDSPDPLYSCDGDCRDKLNFSDKNDHADVISISSCQDDQLTWEDDLGTSMSQLLIEILRKEPAPMLKDLLTNISHDIHRLTLSFHRQARKYRHDVKQYRRYQEAQRKKQPLRGNPRVRSNSTPTSPSDSITGQPLEGKRSNSTASSDDQPTFELHNFQDPQLSSHKPLNMESRLRI